MGWDALIPVLGSLGGVALGAYGTWRIQKRQIDVQQRTRFHDARLENYAKYLGACNGALGMLQVGQDPFDYAKEAFVAFETLRLCAGGGVLDRAVQVHGVYNALLMARVAPTAPQMEPFNNAVAAFVAAARNELHTLE